MDSLFRRDGKLTADGEECLGVVLAEAPEDTLRVTVGRWLVNIDTKARELHRLYEKACNEPLTRRDEERTDELETAIKAAFKALGLGLYLNGDPRGNPVGILTPKTGRFNTMGGSSVGWRL